MLKIVDLSASINNKIILNNINLNINYNEVHVLMGPNGSGKSSLSSIIAGKKEISITKGRILFEKQNITYLSPEEIAHRGIFLSFQDPIEIPGISLINFIKYSINEIRKSKNLKEISSKDFIKQVENVSQIIGFNKAFLSRSINLGFSGGEKKRCEIFQMGMIEPKLAILDEIDSGLDLDALKIIATGILKLKKKKSSILIITHYNRILKLIIPDKIHILYKGKIIKSGSKNLARKIEKYGYEGFKNYL
ncbi:Fe-S cluster assembly ATPase SufC [Candidatus Karelsulcia muelleri]|uniref:Fe-S cluster assembly ATPase SufC n=1 Tax=Candidatus Karelsulcia muelleri TaxID=336810 RepID=UPI00237AC9C0|nr:Fe-S cluster assembly ATPase SufC [Candidatus Karelsulcia muelleri]WDR79075.1 Fe-S cluster assembly ATPase SufC [Candidatus Karelsulcia muelleri]